MKLLKLMILASVLSVSSIQSSKAAVTSIAFMGGAFGVAAKYALYTIGWNYPAFKIKEKNPVIGTILLIPGFLLLDESADSIKFKKISHEASVKKGISLEEMQSFNSEIEEVNLIFGEVVSQVSPELSKEEVLKIWKDHQEYLSPSTYSALKKVIK